MEEGNADAMPQEAVNKGSMEDLDDAEPQDTSAENEYGIFSLNKGLNVETLNIWQKSEKVISSY